MSTPSKYISTSERVKSKSKLTELNYFDYRNIQNSKQNNEEDKSEGPGKALHQNKSPFGSFIKPEISPLVIENESINSDLNQHETPLLESTDIEDTPVEISPAEMKLYQYTFRNYWYLWDSPKPPKAHHCSIWKRCIARMDHHWPWMNNCIGFMNLKLFLIVLIYTWILTLTTLIILASTLGHWFNKKWKILDSQPQVIILGGTVIMWCIFGIFSLLMFSSQYYYISEDTTTIDKMKRTLNLNKKQAKWELVKQVFGGNFSIKWFLPLGIKHNLTIESQYNL